MFTDSSDRLPLLTEVGRGFQGLQHSSAPELNRRVQALFEHLQGRLGFPDTQEGRQNQESFNLILRYAYPEIMIDLADLVFVQHERPMVFLNMDHLERTRRVDPQPPKTQRILATLQGEWNELFRSLGDTLKQEPWLSDPVIVQLLAESYSQYLLMTGNFPWEDPLKEMTPPGSRPVLDVATGLAGFSLIHDWPEGHPPLVLSDSMPFIVEGLRHYLGQTGKKNVEIIEARFPLQMVNGFSRGFGHIQISKFLHHLQRRERKEFLRWARDHLTPGGRLFIIDTDLENRILQEAESDPEYRNKLMPGYLETLISIEDKFCHNLVNDIRDLGLAVPHFDYHEYYDETDAYSHFPGDNLPLKFLGFEILAEKNQS